MKNIFLILKNDLMKIQKNVIAMIVIMGITVIPTLYAWFNISASWDPYGNTGALKLAVASDDKGYESDLIAVKINMGDQILSSLHKNSQFNWVFTDSKDAQKGVKSGEYYAAIVIPEDFSRKMMSVFSSEAEHPDLTYYENEKKMRLLRSLPEKAQRLSRNRLIRHSLRQLPRPHLMHFRR